MNGFDELTLIHTEYKVDELGQRVPYDIGRIVFANVESVTQKEFFEAARSGLQSQYKATLSFAEDYQGEETAEYNGKRYAIYRTFETRAGGIELYLQKEAGVTNG